MCTWIVWEVILRSGFLSHLYHIGIEGRGKERDQNENMASKNDTFSFSETMNNFVEKEMKKVVKDR